jgi:hypothetical protein
MVNLVANPITNELITPSKNQVGYGAVCLETTPVNSLRGAYIRTAYIRGKISDLEQVFKYEGQQFPGKIIHRKSLTPLYEGHVPAINSMTKKPILTNGKLTYQESIYTEDHNIEDYWVVSNKEPQKQPIREIVFYIILTILFIWLLVYTIQTWDSKEVLKEIRTMYHNIANAVEKLLIVIGVFAIFMYFVTDKFKNH